MATALKGIYEYQMDSKGRISIPAKFRDEFTSDGNSSVHLLRRDGCIQLFPQSIMDKLEEDVKDLSFLDKTSNILQRKFFSNLEEAEIGPDGRITIPASFRKYASLVKKVIILGAGNRVEVWSSEKWKEENGDEGVDLGNIFQQVYDQRFRRDVNVKKDN